MRARLNVLPFFLPPQMLSVAQKLSDAFLSPATRRQGATLLHSFAGLTPTAALELEGEIAAVSCASASLYRAHLRRFAFNVACNRALATTQPDALVQMSDRQLSAGTVTERIQSEQEAQLLTFVELLRQRYDNVVKAQSSESILRCSKCGSSNVSWNQKQTRGADESSTIFCSCLDCKKRWRFS